jgi:hypothetical protein
MNLKLLLMQILKSTPKLTASAKPVALRTVLIILLSVLERAHLWKSE